LSTPRTRSVKARSSATDGGRLSLAGKITDADSTVLLDGYRKFGGHLTKK
jgi:hypothetical protein